MCTKISQMVGGYWVEGVRFERCRRMVFPELTTAFPYLGEIPGVARLKLFD